jgi:predicted acylesterase/phospholipase RssA
MTQSDASITNSINTKSSGDGICRVLALDGGGAKGFYTLGVLSEIEAMVHRPLCESFDLIFGTSTGAIIAALLARGDSVANVRALYETHVPSIMKSKNTSKRTSALHTLAHEVFGQSQSDIFKTGIGIVATNWSDERPMIFKASVGQAHGSKGSFQPFFGCCVADAIIASCSAYPFFKTHTVRKGNGDIVELADGGFCANNPALYAIANATLALKYAHDNLRVVSVGVGSYPAPSIWKQAGRLLTNYALMRHVPGSDFLQKVLGTNTYSMDVLRTILFKDVPTIRINNAYPEPLMATDLLEHDLTKLNRLTQKGRLSFAEHEQLLSDFLTPSTQTIA